MNAGNDCYVPEYCSLKSKRVVPSIMGGELYAFSAFFDQLYIVKHELESILGQLIPIMMFTDSKISSTW